MLVFFQANLQAILVSRWERVLAKYKLGMNGIYVYLVIVINDVPSLSHTHSARASSNATANDRMDMEKRSAPAPPSRHGHSSKSELQVELRGTVSISEGIPRATDTDIYIDRKR